MDENAEKNKEGIGSEQVLYDASSTNQPVPPQSASATQPPPNAQPTPPGPPQPPGIDTTRIPSGAGGFFSKQKLIRLIIGAVVLLVIIFLIFGVFLPSRRPKTPENVELVYWGVWEDPVIISQMIDDFTRQNPHIKIRYERQDIKSLGKYIDRLNTRITNGGGPDIFRYHNSWLPEVKSLLLPLSADVVSSSELENQYYNVIKKDVGRNGAYYGIPLGLDTIALFVNNDIARAAGITQYPATWDDIDKVARQLTVKDGSGKIQTAGIALGTYDNIAHAPEIISLLLIQNGANPRLLADSLRSKGGGGNAEDALEFYVSFARGDGKVWDETLDNSKLAFTKGNLAMYFGYSWDILEIKAMNPNLDFAVVPVPRLVDRSDTIANYWVEGISVKTQHAEEASEFLRFLAKKQTLEKVFAAQSKTRLFGTAYPRRDMAELLRDNQHLAPFVQQFESATSTLFYADTYDDSMVDALNVYLGNAVRSMLADGTSPQSAIETLSKGVDDVMTRYGE